MSHSVMIGFLTGVAVNIICGQLGDLTGSAANGPNAVAKAFDVITHPAHIGVPPLLTGVGALVILFGLTRTRLNTVSALIALIIPTLTVLATGAEVTQVDDQGAIPPTR